MSNAQRKVVLIVAILLAPLLILYGMGENSFLIAFGGPILSLGLGIYVWVGRKKEHPSGGG